MNGLITAIPTAAIAFSATNLDDLVILLLFFSQVNATFRRRHIVVGQYVGFAVLTIASLPGFFGGLILSRHWMGLLGLVPIAIGLNSLLNPQENSPEAEEATEESQPLPLASFLSPQTYSVTVVTVANGSDNIGIYVPLFANSALESLLAILGVFFTLVGVWCYAADRLTSQPAIANFLSHYGNILVPFVLMGLGAFIVLENRSLSLLSLVAACLCLMGLVKRWERSSEIAEN